MTDTTLASIFLVEDDEVMCTEFERMVETHPQFTLVGSARTISQARQQLESVVPDVAIVDLGLPDGDGAVLIDMLRSSSPGTAVLVSTIFGDEAHVIRAIEAGARGYLLKDTTLEEFARSILLVRNGDSPLSPQVARHLLKRFSPVAESPRRSAASASGELTGREIDILTCISRGFTATEAAAMLNISHHTVTTHIRNIYTKLSVTNRMQAVNQARTRGLIG